MMEQRLQSGLAALNLPVEGIPALVRYGDLLIETNKVMNLTATLFSTLEIPIDWNILKRSLT